jgi:nitrogenase molybdenum-cofactor synthesis protein NifE
MIANLDKLTEGGCSSDRADKVCRSRGGESCAFDGAMIVLQPIADTAHIVHGPIACCGNSWEGRGSLSTKGDLHRMGFTTDMSEMDIIYGSEKKLYKAILQTAESVKPKAIFVHATCVSGLIGEDIEAVCREAETELGIRVIPVNAPGFVGPKNLGNRTFLFQIRFIHFPSWIFFSDHLQFMCFDLIFNSAKFILSAIRVICIENKFSH